MKKYIFISLFILTSLCLSLVLCSNTASGSVSSNNNTASFSAKDKNVFTVDSYYEYLKFINSTELPDDFIYYNDICILGEFVDFICMSDIKNGDFSHYLYSVKDKSGVEITLYIKDADSYEEIEIEQISSVDPHNLRTVEATSPVMYECEGIKYTYVEGKLNSVKWQSDKWVYTVYINDPCLGEYPDDSSTIIGKLMNQQTALAAIETINEASAHKAKTANFIRNMIFCLVLVIIIPATAVFIIRKKKKKAAVATAPQQPEQTA